LTLLAVAAILLGPIVYQGTRAYQDIFVERVPHQTRPLLPAPDPAGTPGQAGAPTAASGNGGSSSDEVASTGGPGGAVPPAPTVELPTWDGTEPLTLLLLGVDRREDEPSRTDTMILVWVDPVAKQAAMLAIPRDLKVIVPGYGVHKINAAYAIGEAEQVPGGGPALTIQTIEANFGIRVDHFAQVDFQGFVRLVDLVGGVTIDVPYPIKDDAYPAANNQYTRVYFAPGWQHMDGERALQYTRTRHADGDAQRAARQQQLLLALRQKASLLDLLPQASEILATLSDSVRTDLSPEQAIKLARLATEIPRESITQYSLMNAVWVEDPDGVFYLIPDWNAVGQVLSQFTRTVVMPPAAALAQVDYTIPIRIENGTTNPGLAARVAEVLIANGFTNVTFAPAADPGYHPTTTIVDRSGNLTTAALVAAIAGVDPSVIDVQYLGPPTPTPTTTPSPTATPNPTATPEPTATPTATPEPKSTAALAGTTGAARAPTNSLMPRAGTPTDGAASAPASETATPQPSATGTPAPTATTTPPPTAVPTREATPAPDATQVGIVIVLGDDAPDPAWYAEPDS
jgi:LCP family protein required for cell wall assembly